MDSYSQKDYPKEYLLIYIIVTTIKNIILCVSLFAKEPTQESQELQIPDDLNLDDFLPENTKPESWGCFFCKLPRKHLMVRM